MSENTKRPNRLINETSPYLRQHAYNPVDWFPWGKEALEKARTENKIIFLSVGYAACHWCHVMERESFEDSQTAALMNDHFVNIKVDKEERPDIDQIYMKAVLLMTQHGGWPMSVFLTPEGEPFYGGTYYPPVPKMGMPSFSQVLTGIAKSWRERADEVKDSAKQMTGALREMAELAHLGTTKNPPSLESIDKAVESLSHHFDSTYGGFGGAPKFFHVMDLRLCLRHWKRTGEQNSLSMVTHTLETMARGGIYDQLGGGFHRYSTDERWLAPHFEKMLYDNALLASVYLETFQVTEKTFFKTIAIEIFDYVLRKLTSPEGGFYSTEDADTEGEEGKYYVWDEAEIDSLLGENSIDFKRAFDVGRLGNWEGKTILRRVGNDESDFNRQKEILLRAREGRTPPFLDQKIQTSWNGLMVSAFAQGYQVLGEQKYLNAASEAARFLWEKMWDGSHLRHCYKDGKVAHRGCLDDYANLVEGLITLYQADFKNDCLEKAEILADQMITQFWDEEKKNFFYTGKDHESLIARTKDIEDGATPSGNSMAVTALLKLGKILQDQTYLEKAEQTIQSFSRLIDKSPAACGQLLVGLDFQINSPFEIVLVPGNSEVENQSVLARIRKQFLPSSVLVMGHQDSKSPLVVGKQSIENRTTTYVCRNFTCQDPITDIDKLQGALT